MLSAAPVLQAVEPFVYGEIHRSALAQGSYVHWSNFYQNENPGGYERLDEIFFGQIWTHELSFDLYRGFVVIDVPRLKGVLTREEAELPDWSVPGVSTLRVTAISASLVLPGLGDGAHDVSEGRPFAFRLTDLPAAGLIDGTLDPQAAFAALGDTGNVIQEWSLQTTYGPNGGLYFDQAFVNLLNHRDGGPMVFSFVMPVENVRGHGPLVNLENEFTMTIGYFGYPPFPAVPEPATYALAGAALCLAVIWRARRTARVERSVAL